MDYKDTLNLPKTDFPMKANLKATEERLLKDWDDSRLYERLIEHSEKREKKFILHDGPPYANGHIHLGTALNKILKDIIVRYKTMSGCHAPFIPGWDCHGLPIEHNVDKTLKSKDSISKGEKRRLCRDYAGKFMDIQRNEFERLGSMGRYKDPYLTMNYPYEANTVRKLADFMKNGGLYRANKPIYWCSSCRTALAEAEVEYAQKISPSIYVKFRIKSDLTAVLGDAAMKAIGGRDIFAVIWTTTPWTIPSNLAISLNPNFEYSFIDVGNEILIIEESLSDELIRKFGYSYSENENNISDTVPNYKIVANVSGKKLENKVAAHPFIARDSILILGSHVKKDAGTGLVHTAPGHGDDDYAVGLKYNLPAYAPINNEGKFLQEVESFAGMHVFESNPFVVEKLKEVGALILEEKIEHSYPHCWRCKKPVILRSTKQWFISMKNNDLREKSLKEIKSVNWIPTWGIDRISGMLEARPDWCVSRQRVWGVPITAFYCKNCGEALVDYELTLKIADEFEKYGADIWYEKPADFFISLGLDGKQAGLKCKKCGENSFEKEEDILDVWFDSGVSYFCVLKNDKEIKKFAFPADLYLEGSDQHRGWFHSSLLISLGSGDGLPYKTVLTHGFVVDQSGKKMSKSLGNVISPDEIINKYGADILRLWAASEDYKNDMRISNEIIQRLAEGYRKIRNTFRFILGNIYDFNEKTDSVPYADLSSLDKYALHRVATLLENIDKHYAAYDFHLVFQGIYKFITEFSSFYLDIVKDILYVEGKKSVKRRSVQTVINYALNNFIKYLAPIIPFSASETWDHYKKSAENDWKSNSDVVAAHERVDVNRSGSLFFEEFGEVDESFVNYEIADKFNKLLKIRDVVLSNLEEARNKKFIGSSLEAKIILKLGEDDYETVKLFGEDELKDIFIISGLEIIKQNEPEISAPEAIIEKADGHKCSRCWKYDIKVGTFEDFNDVCDRCHSVLHDNFPK